MSISRRTQDTGASQASTFYARSQDHVPALRADTAIPEVAKLDSSKYLTRQDDYPLAVEPTSCFSLKSLLADMTADEPMDEAATRLELAERLRRVILRSANESPGSFVFGARSLPVTRGKMEKFFVRCGFDTVSVAFLTVGVPEIGVEEPEEDEGDLL